MMFQNINLNIEMLVNMVLISFDFHLQFTIADLL
uniref:Uncharacterized protein n=1 Tax=Anguilla anguilla TaxID=7936 RepID=A0A0E9T661_ANGAN